MEAIKEHRCNWHFTGKPTYWPSDINKVPNLLDFSISRKLPMTYIKIEKEHDLCSDHSLVLLTLSGRVILKAENPTLTNRQINWEGFKEELSNKINLKVPLKPGINWIKKWKDLLKIFNRQLGIIHPRLRGNPLVTTIKRKLGNLSLKKEKPGKNGSTLEPLRIKINIST